MSQLTVYAKDLQGWTPEIDPRRQGKPGIISGRNFVDGLDGPYAAFASQFVNWNLFDVNSRQKITELKVGTKLLYGTPTGLFRFNPTSQIIELLLPITTTEPFWPWSVAQVGGLYYIAQFNIGIWEYDPVNETLGYVTTPFGALCRGVTESAGRLIYITDTVVGCSALDDGTDLTPSTITGAQAQALSIVGKTAYRVDQVSDGFIVAMAEGLLKGEQVQAAFVFRFYALSTDVRCFSPNAAAYIPDVGMVYLDAAGLRATNGAEPAIWEALQGAFIRENFILNIDPTTIGAFCLYYSRAARQLFVSFANGSQEGLMEVNFVYNVPSQRWGSFDHPNYGLFETQTDENNLNSLSYMGPDGYMRTATNSNIAYDVPEFPAGINDYIFRPVLVELPIRVEIDASAVVSQVGFTELNFSDNDPHIYGNFNHVALYYVNYLPYSDTMLDAADDPDWDFVPAVYTGGSYWNFDTSGGVEITALIFTPPRMTLDSNIMIGPFRFSDQQTADETSKVDQVIIGFSNAVAFEIFEDYDEETGNEDWSSGTTVTEDWSAGNQTINEFALRLRSSDGALNETAYGDEELEPITKLMTLQTYAPIGFSAIFHSLLISTDDFDDVYAIKYVDLTGALTGKALGLFNG